MFSPEFQSQAGRNRDQLLVMYNGNVKLVDDLLERKRSENMVKEHPDFPDYPSMNLYWVPLVAYGMYVQTGQKPIFLIKTTRFPR